MIGLSLDIDCLSEDCGLWLSHPFLCAHPPGPTLALLHEQPLHPDPARGDPARW